MRLHRFYISNDSLGGKNFDITDSDIINQLKNVFRFRAGDEVVLFNGSGEDFIYKIIDVNSKNIFLEFVNKKKGIREERKIILLVSLPKKDKYEWIIEKGTEIGVQHFVPIISERTDKIGINLDRLKKISREAVEQSGLSVIPEIGEVIGLNEAMESVKKLGVNVYYLNFDGVSIDEIEKSFIGDNSKGMAIFIGPEGGWGESDIALFKKAEIKSMKLGESVLKTETAAIVTAGILLC